MTELVSVREAAEYTGYSDGHIRHLLIHRLIDGRKFGRDWFTTKESIDKYLATNPRRGPQKQK